MRRETKRPTATETLAPSRLSSLTSQPSRPSASGQRPTASPCAAPSFNPNRVLSTRSRTDLACRPTKAVGRHGRHGQHGRLATCRPNRQRPCPPKAIGRHGSQDDATRIQNRINPRTSVESAKIRVLFFAFVMPLAGMSAFAASRDACRRC